MVLFALTLLRQIGSSGAIGFTSDHRREWWSFNVTMYSAVLLPARSSERRSAWVC